MPRETLHAGSPHAVLNTHVSSIRHVNCADRLSERQRRHFGNQLTPHVVSAKQMESFDCPAWPPVGSNAWEDEVMALILACVPINIALSVM